MTEDEIKVAFASKFSMKVPGTKDLKRLERMRHLKIWYDHSDILNHTYISFMASTLYNPNIYLTTKNTAKNSQTALLLTSRQQWKNHIFIFCDNPKVQTRPRSITIEHSGDENKIKEAVNIILQNDSIKKSPSTKT